MHAKRLAYPPLLLLASSCSAAATQSPSLTVGKATLGVYTGVKWLFVWD